MSAVTALSDTAALTGRRLVHLRRAPGRLIGIIMNPLVMMIAVGYLFKNSIVVPGSGNYREYIMAGVAAQLGLASIGPTAMAVATELRGGLIDRFRSLPVSRMTLLVGQTFADLLISALGLVVIMIIGLLLGWRTHTGPLSVAAGFGLLLLFIYVMLWIGVLLGMVLRNFETIEAVGALVLVAFTFLSNALLSPRGLPGWVRPVAEWNPVSSVVAAIRHLWGNPVITGHDFPSRHPGVVTAISLTVILLVTVPLSLRAYRRSALR